MVPALLFGRWLAAGAVALAVLATAALVLAWNTQQRVKSFEAELVKRQQDSGAQATEARTLARQAEQSSRESGAKLALLRRALAGRDPKGALLGLIKLLEREPSNDAVLRRLKAK